MLRKLGRHLRDQWAGFTALFLVFAGGTAWAVDGPLAGQNTVGSEDIIGNEVKSDDIGNGRIFNLDIADEIITGAKLKDGTVGPGDLQDLPALTPLTPAAAFALVEIPAGCYVDLDGVVHLEGLIKRTGSGTPQAVAELPPACQPQRNQFQTGSRLSAEGVGVGAPNLFIYSEGGHVLVDTNYPAQNEFISFDGISFRGKASGQLSGSQEAGGTDSLRVLEP